MSCRLFEAMTLWRQVSSPRLRRAERPASGCPWARSFFRTSFRCWLLPVTLAALALLPQIACLRGGKPDTLVMAIEAPPRGFDPRLNTVNPYSARIMQLVYDTLMVKDEHFDFVPSLADRFEQSADGTVIIFHLRPQILFHNRKLLTSADVKYTFESILSPAMKSPIRGSIDKLSSIDTPDPLTVVFHAREPFYTFIGNLPAIGIVPEGSGPEIINAPIGTGPYRFVSYAEAEPVRLEANPDYWGGAPAIPHLAVQVINDNSTRQAALMSGEVDLAYNTQFDPETIRALQGRRGLQVEIAGGSNIAHLGVNLTSPLLSNQKLRQAIAYAIDRETIIHRLLRDQARRADSILPPEQWAYNPNVTVYDYNPAGARQLLDEAGFPDPDGDGPQPRFALTLMTTTNQLSRNIATVIQDNLRQVGIQLDLESLETATLFDKIAKAQFDLYYLISVGGNQSTDIFQFVYHSRYQNPEFNDAIAKLRGTADQAAMQPLLNLLASILSRRDYCPDPEVDSLVEQAAVIENPESRKELYLRIAGLLTDRGGANRSRYCNPQVDRWIVEAERARDRQAKRDLYEKIQLVVSDELPQIYLWYPANVLVARTRVHDIQIEPSGSWYFIRKLTLSGK
jgi:peptide/nickel transport system substrate-binding protein